MKKDCTIYVFGNPLLEFDSLPIELIPELFKEFPEIQFTQFDPNENLKPINKELIIIDTAKGIEDVCLITNMDSILDNKLYSPHDLDLGFNLKLLERLGKLDSVKILAVPMKIKKQAALAQLVDLLYKMLRT